MARPVRMPPLGQTTDAFQILAWLKAEGDPVAQGDSLLEIETDKATHEVEATSAGTLLRILYGVGETIEEGTVIAYIGDPGEEIPEQALGSGA